MDRLSVPVWCFVCVLIGSEAQAAKPFRAWRSAPPSSELASTAQRWVDTRRVRQPSNWAEPWRAVARAIESGSPVTRRFAGRVSALRVESGSDGDQLWIGASSGGLWHLSTDGTWLPISDTLAGSPAIGDFLRTSTGTLIVGTGDAWRYPGSGIYLSNDDGASWHAAQLPLTPSAIYRVAADRNAPHHLLAASAQGLLGSLDGGENWSLLAPGHWTDVQQDLHHAEVWHAGAYELGVMRSSDGGSSFSVTPGTTAVITGQIGRITLAQSAAKAGLMFALVADFGGSNGLFRSVDHGLQWVRISEGPDVSWGQAFHTNAIAAHPANPDILVIGRGGLKLTSNALTETPLWSEIADGGHADFTRLIWRNDNQLYAANDGGLFLLDVLGSGAVSDLNQDLALQQVFDTGALALDPNRLDRAWAGLQDNGLVTIEADAGDWRMSGHGCCDAGWVTAARGDADRLAVSLGIPFDRYLSFNGGESVSRNLCNFGAVPGNPPLAFDPRPVNNSNARLMLLSPAADQSAARLFIQDLSRHCATGIHTVPLPDSSMLQPDFLSIADDPARLRILISASVWSADSRPAMVTSLPGSRGPPYTASRVEPPAPGPGRLAVDAFHASRSYWWSLGSAPDVWLSDRADFTDWRAATSNLASLGSALQVRRVIAHPLRPDTLFLASNLGVLISEDRGVHWSPWADGLPAVVDATDLAIHLDEPVPMLWMASCGRGIWRRALRDDRLFRDGFEG